MKKRVLGLLLSCCMLLALLPATALAAGDTCPMCQSNDTTWTITETYHRLSCNACTGIIIPPEAHSWEDQPQTNETQYWFKCKVCSYESAKKDIPEVKVNANDRVCRTQDYHFSFTVPENCVDAGAGYEFPMMGDEADVEKKDGVYYGTVKKEWYQIDASSFDVYILVETDDGAVFSASFSVSILDQHVGGEATCTKKAQCEVCGEAYGELDVRNHNLTHVAAKEATAEAEGNIEYWVCADCGKIFADKELTKELKKEETVIAKKTAETGGSSDAKDESKDKTATESDAPQTGDSASLALWIALVALSGAAIGVVCLKKRKSE